MAKPSIRAEVNNFVQGLITEASPLNFPPNASLDEENFELNRDGSRDRRLGIGHEPGFVLRTAPLSAVEMVTAKVSTHKWANVNGSLLDEFLVVQTEQTLSFFNISADILSGAGYIGNIVLSSFPVDTIYSFTSAEGSLIVAAGTDTIAVVSYISSVFSVSYERLKVRDVWGVEVPTLYGAYEADASYRGSYNEFHSYNLRNQSWGIPRKTTAGAIVDPALTYSTVLGVYPSNTEVVWTGLQFQPVTAGVSTELLYPNLYQESLGMELKSTKGYFIIDLLRRGQSRVTEYFNNNTKYPQLLVGGLSIPVDLTSGGASVVTEFAGRVFYSGFTGEITGRDARSPVLTNFVVFSKLVRNRADIVKCYQEGDPTSRENSDLLETDGGFVKIVGAKSIIGLINLDSHLIIIADNGVWTLSGGSDYGFSATNYKVTKISSFGGLSFSSVVVEGGRAFFWSESGIYVIAKDQFGTFGVTNITQTTIQSFYDNISSTTKMSAQGVYDSVAKKVRWLYKTGNRFSGESVTKELILDTVLNIFYVNRIHNLTINSAEVISPFASVAFRRGEVFNPVYVGADSVLSSTDVVGINETIRSSGFQSVRYVTLQTLNGSVYLTFSYYNNSDFKDWEEVDGTGVDAKAFLLTGQQTTGDSAIAKQIPYLVMYFRRTEVGVTPNFVPNNQSGCFMRGQWDFSNTINSNKWTPLAQVYRYRRAQYVNGLDDPYDNGFELVITKSKLRGRGKAFSLYLETEPTKDCRIIGWSISLNGNTVT